MLMSELNDLLMLRDWVAERHKSLTRNCYYIMASVGLFYIVLALASYTHRPAYTRTVHVHPKQAGI